MKTLKENSLLIFGYMVFCFGALSTVVDFVERTQFLFPSNMGIILGNGAISLIGLVTIAVAGRLKKFGQRLDRIESGEPSAR